MSQSAQPPSGWYPDPAGSGDERYWDGGNWSQVTRPSGGPNQNQYQQYGQSGPAPAAYGQPYGGYGASPQQQYGPAGQGQYGPAGQGQYGYPAQGQYGSARLAGWWWRVLAGIIDLLVFLIPQSILQNLIMGDAMLQMDRWIQDWTIALEQGSTEIPPLPEAFVSTYVTFAVVSLALVAIYRTVMVKLFGGTVGQLATGLRVVNEGDHSLGRISWGSSALRGVLAVVLGQVPLLGLINVLLPLMNQKKQTLHDMAAKTVVVKN